MINPKCNKCHVELSEPGAIVISPPMQPNCLGEYHRKYHICPVCYTGLCLWLDTAHPPVKPVKIPSGWRRLLRVGSKLRDTDRMLGKATGTWYRVGADPTHLRREDIVIRRNASKAIIQRCEREIREICSQRP